MKMIEVQVPVIRCEQCDTTYDLVAPILPARWIYRQPPKCKRAKHPLATQEAVDLHAVETLPLKAILTDSEGMADEARTL